ncbi:MAG: HAMP domain-containing sensor histidine kinase [Myxococcota bacterium]
MGPLAYYVRGHLRRRLFVWFGVTILLSGLVGAGMASLLHGPRSAWRDSIDRATVFVGHRFAEVWDDPAARDHLARSAAEELGVEIELLDDQGRSLARFGEACPSRHSGQFSAPVRRDGQHLGQLHACVSRLGGGGGPALVLGILGALAVLWAASGVIAWRLTRPLARLVRVTRAIGQGQLDARVRMPWGPGELSFLARAVNDMADRIQRQLADQRELLAVVSHEIRTPLGHMRVLLDLARDGADPATLDEIEAELLEVDRLVDRLLASSRLEFEKLDRRPLEAQALASRALARAGLPAERLQVSAEVADSLLQGDATLLGRALANLIENAQTHGEGLVALRIELREGLLCFGAEDAGPGLPVAERERLFDSFVRGAQGGKLGLGLALVQRIAVAHGGRAFAEDREGGGARVGFGVARGESAD